MIFPAKAILHKGKEQPVLRFHPWIFSGAIRQISGNPAEGDVIEVFSANGQYLATGHFQNNSISIKLFSWQQQSINETFWVEKIRSSRNLRKAMGLLENSHTNCYRLVHNEGDSWPGLILDVYGSTIVFQAHSLGMYNIRETLAKALQTVCREENIKSVYDKSSTSLRKMTGMNVSNGFLWGDVCETEVIENGCRFLIDIEQGQKTGFFLDQRDNRKIIGNFSDGKRVLNMFSYTGGFSVYALKSGATFVHSVDSSAAACELADKNAALNGFTDSRHQSFAIDARNFLQKTEKDAYDLIILDPPAFAKNLGTRHQALKGYAALNAETLRKIAPGGILATFSCSQVVDRQQFSGAVLAAAIESGQTVKIIGQLGQPADHPINIFQPESEYLKGLILYVE